MRSAVPRKQTLERLQKAVEMTSTGSRCVHLKSLLVLPGGHVCILCFSNGVMRKQQQQGTNMRWGRSVRVGRGGRWRSERLPWSTHSPESRRTDTRGYKGTQLQTHTSLCVLSKDSKDIHKRAHICINSIGPGSLSTDRAALFKDY